MVIYKSDGSEYSVQGTKALQTYRPGGQDQQLFDKLDREQIHLAGSPIKYYKCFIDSDFDDVYMESVDSIIAQEGYEIYCHFEPIRPTQQMTSFGIDSPDEMLFNFNLTEWREIIGEMPKIKSLIFCSWDGTTWEIIQNEQGDPYQLWTKYRLTVVARKYQKSRVDQQPDRKDAIDQYGNQDKSLRIY